MTQFCTGLIDDTCSLILPDPQQAVIGFTSDVRSLYFHFKITLKCVYSYIEFNATGTTELSFISFIRRTINKIQHLFEVTTDLALRPQIH